MHSNIGDVSLNMTRIQRKQANKKRKRENKEKNKMLSKSSKQPLSLPYDIEPLTNAQERAFDIWYESANALILSGLPGTGKSYLSMYFGLSEIEDNPDIDKLVIIRSTVPVREMGFLSGDDKEKVAKYEEPYSYIANKLYDYPNAYRDLKSRKEIEFMSTAFLRSVTIDNAVVFVDEAQNMTDEELHTIITRIGKNSRLIISGDTGQDDLTSERYNTQSGFSNIMRIFNKMNNTSIINFGIEDIVRSGFVKEYLIARYS